MSSSVIRLQINKKLCKSERISRLSRKLSWIKLNAISSLTNYVGIWLHVQITLHMGFLEKYRRNHGFKKGSQCRNSDCLVRPIAWNEASDSSQWCSQCVVIWIRYLQSKVPNACRRRQRWLRCLRYGNLHAACVIQTICFELISFTRLV